MASNRVADFRPLFTLIFLLLLLRMGSGAFKSDAIGSLNFVFSFLYVLPVIVLMAIVVKVPRRLLYLVLLLAVSLSLSLLGDSFGFHGLFQYLNASVRYVLPLVTFYYVWAEYKADGGLLRGRFAGRYLILFSFMALASALAVLVGNYREIQGEFRLEYPFENPNTLGIFYAVAAWLSYLYLKAGVSARHKMPLMACYFISVVFVVLSGSLNGMAIVVVNIAYVVYMRPGYRVFKLLGFIVLLCLAYFYVDFEGILGRLDKVIFSIDWTSPTSGGSSLVWRLQTWILYVSEIGIADFFVGRGPGASRVWFEAWAPGYQRYSVGDIPGTHNDYLMIFFDFGLVGFFVFFIMFFSFYKKAIRMREGGLVAFSVAILLSMFFDNILDSILMVYLLYFSLPYIFERQRVDGSARSEV
ncbi:O-antigen ligase family protein [Brachymonas wangyanguii]|uniref:O-antigen ligase family protein n=1 Tax=Brachymonas wangyanguii TaxID=3130163 RepID=UPI00307DFB51